MVTLAFNDVASSMPSLKYSLTNRKHGERLFRPADIKKNIVIRSLCSASTISFIPLGATTFSRSSTSRKDARSTFTVLEKVATTLQFRIIEESIDRFLEVRCALNGCASRLSEERLILHC